MEGRQGQPVKAQGVERTTAPHTVTEITLPTGEGATIKLVLIPAGKFIMGSQKSGREVAITKPFHMGATEVTQAQYEAVMGKHANKCPGPDNPVDSASWAGAVQFCRRLSEKTGRKVGLPTEAQWEYACRAGSGTRFSFGDDEAQLADYAWVTANSESKTHPVGQKKPNAWGLYDMPGNAWEWCSDDFADSLVGHVKVEDPPGPASGSNRVLRGGCSGGTVQFWQSAGRFGHSPDGNAGFRVVVEVNQP